MSIGSNVGKSFLFGGSGSPGFQSVAAQPQTTGPLDDMVGQALDGLQQTEGLTREYYVQWANAKNFARNVWKRYNIDVTNPNPDSEEEIRLHQMFLKNIAAVKTLGNNLRAGRENEKAIMQRQLVDPNVVATGEPGQITRSGDFVHTGLTQEDKLIAQRVGRTVRSKQERDALNAQLNDYIGGLVSELEQTTDPGQRFAIGERLNAMRNVSATYDPTADRDRFQRDLYKRQGKRNLADEVRHLWLKAQDDFHGGTNNIIEQIESIPGVMSASYGSKKDEFGRDRAIMQVKLRGKAKGEENMIDINMDDNREGLRAFATIFQKSDGFEALDIDQISLPQELQDRRASDPGFFNMVSTMRDLMSKEGEGTFLGLGSKNKGVEKEVASVNDTLRGALNRGLRLPTGEVITDVEFFTGSRTGKPHLDVTLENEEEERIDVTPEFLDDFINVNSRVMFDAQAPQQFGEAPVAPQINIQPGEVIEITPEVIQAYQRDFPGATEQEIIDRITIYNENIIQGGQ